MVSFIRSVFQIVYDVLSSYTLLATLFGLCLVMVSLHLRPTPSADFVDTTPVITGLPDVVSLNVEQSKTVALLLPRAYAIFRTDLEQISQLEKEIFAFAERAESILVTEANPAFGAEQCAVLNSYDRPHPFSLTSTKVTELLSIMADHRVFVQEVFKPKVEAVKKELQTQYYVYDIGVQNMLWARLLSYQLVDSNIDAKRFQSFSNELLNSKLEWSVAPNTFAIERGQCVFKQLSESNSNDSKIEKFLQTASTVPPPAFTQLERIDFNQNYFRLRPSVPCRTEDPIAQGLVLEHLKNNSKLPGFSDLNSDTEPHRFMPEDTITSGCREFLFPGDGRQFRITIANSETSVDEEVQYYYNVFPDRTIVPLTNAPTTNRSFISKYGTIYLNYHSSQHSKSVDNSEEINLHPYQTMFVYDELTDSRQYISTSLSGDNFKALASLDKPTSVNTPSDIAISLYRDRATTNSQAGEVYYIAITPLFYSEENDSILGGETSYLMFTID